MLLHLILTGETISLTVELKYWATDGALLHNSCFTPTIS